MRFISAMTIACVLACPVIPAWAGGAPAAAIADGGMIWLEPFSYMQMRRMREKMKKLAAERKQTGAPGREKTGAGGRPSGRPSGGYSTKIIHLRDGAFPPGGPVRHKRFTPAPHKPPAGAVKDVMWLEKPDRGILEINPQKRRNKATANYKTAQGGDYRIVAYRNAGLQNGRPTHLFGFYEFMAHGDKPGLKQPSPETRAGYFKGRPEFEISRDYEDEGERYRSRAGNTARLTVSFRGRRLQGVPVTLITAQGWRQTQSTDENGMAVFTLIKEDFPDGKTDKRKSSLYIARASYLAPPPGSGGADMSRGARYTATMSIRVSPSAYEWESRSTAYLVTIFTLGAAGTAIAVRRRRKKIKPARNGK